MHRSPFLHPQWLPHIAASNRAEAERVSIGMGQLPLASNRTVGVRRPARYG
jgi:hypothetical protein